MYQRIDMTQSTVNQSVMMKNSKFQYPFGNTGNIFMSNNESNLFNSGSDKNIPGFSRSGSLGLLPSSVSQEETIINALGSQKILE